MIPESWLRLAAEAVEWVAAQRPGWLSRSAREGSDLVPELAAAYLPRLDALPASIRALVRRRILAEGASREVWVQAALEALRRSSGEAGAVARTHPAWAEDHLRRLGNLVWLWAKGAPSGGRRSGVPAGAAEFRPNIGAR